MIRARFLSLSLILLSLLPVVEAADEDLRILFIGNSYTGQVKQSIAGLFAASPHVKAKLEFITPGGRTLAQHLSNEKTTARIEEGDWDFVVLQDQSQTPAVFPDKFQAAAKELSRIIEKAGAQTVFYQTWGRRDGDKQNPKMFPTYKSMQRALSKEYSSAARRNKALLAPVGDAWAIVREENEDLGKRLYKGDGSHPSKEGALIAACVFYTVLTGEEGTQVSYSGGVEDSDARVIRDAVEELDLRGL
jgi:hypothetical protein